MNFFPTLGLCMLLATNTAGLMAESSGTPIVEPAPGWADDRGGRGGRIVRVTSLAASGPGSLRDAIAQTGPRIVVFEVGGVIDLGAKAVVVDQPFLTIAGQTGPYPGITLIRGGIEIRTHHVVIRHLRVRPGEAGAGKGSGVDFDGITTIGAHDVVIDHCSLTWATDENLSASGPRFVDGGTTMAEFRAATSRRITFSNNILAEGLAYSTHAKGEHSKGSLIHDNVSKILIIGNLYAHNAERSPLFKGAVQGSVINNLIYDPGARAVHYNLIAHEWVEHKHVPGEMQLLGNVMRAGPSTTHPIALLMVGGSGHLRLHMRDNLAVDRIGMPLPLIGRYTTAAIALKEGEWALPPGVTVMPTESLEDHVLARVGARPWDRDDIDRRIVANVSEGRGGIIDSETEVGGYPTYPETRAPFVEGDWNLSDMTPRKPLWRRPPPR